MPRDGGGVGTRGRRPRHRGSVSRRTSPAALRGKARRAVFKTSRKHFEKKDKKKRSSLRGGCHHGSAAALVVAAVVALGTIVAMARQWLRRLRVWRLGMCLATDAVAACKVIAALVEVVPEAVEVRPATA